MVDNRELQEMLFDHWRGPSEEEAPNDMDAQPAQCPKRSCTAIILVGPRINGVGSQCGKHARRRALLHENHVAGRRIEIEFLASPVAHDHLPALVDAEDPDVAADLNPGIVFPITLQFNFAEDLA